MKIKNLEKEIKQLEKQGHDTKSLLTSLKILKNEYHSNLSGWDKVQLARSKERPSTKEFLGALFTDFIEFHGDRKFGDDGAVVGGIARLGNHPVTVIGIVKGKTTEENIRTNFGMVHPEGYRKALRLMEQAQKFNRPIITLIDTPGAYPGIGAEERGQAEAIADLLMKSMSFTVPIISIILGEAGSGGALALAVGNQVWMMEHAIYSILSPEGFASILYKDASKAKDVVDDMKITSEHLLAMGIVDLVIEENDINDTFDSIIKDISRKLNRSLDGYSKMRPKQIQKERQKRFRAMGDIHYEK